jgi:hypothetical protein
LAENFHYPVNKVKKWRIYNLYRNKKSSVVIITYRNLKTKSHHLHNMETYNSFI